MYALLTLVAVCSASSPTRRWSRRLSQVHADIEQGIGANESQLQSYHCLVGLFPGFSLINQFLGAQEIIRLVVTHIARSQRSLCSPIHIDQAVRIIWLQVRSWERSRMSSILSPLPVAFIEFGREFRLHPDCKDALLILKPMVDDSVVPYCVLKNLGLKIATVTFALAFTFAVWSVTFAPRGFH